MLCVQSPPPPPRGGKRTWIAVTRPDHSNPLYDVVYVKSIRSNNRRGAPGPDPCVFHLTLFMNPRKKGHHLTRYLQRDQTASASARECVSALCRGAYVCEKFAVSVMVLDMAEGGELFLQNEDERRQPPPEAMLPIQDFLWAVSASVRLRGTMHENAARIGNNAVTRSRIWEAADMYARDQSKTGISSSGNRANDNASAKTNPKPTVVMSGPMAYLMDLHDRRMSLVKVGGAARRRPGRTPRTK